jgi:hypothetical protein
MKNLRSRLVAFSFVLAAAPVQFAVAGEPTPKIVVNQENLAKLSPADQERVLVIADRLETITTMDRSELTSSERKALRTEARQLKEEAREFNRGGEVIYISAGTIIIILLLILILT